jgi:molecular chaperone IbpA
MEDVAMNTEFDFAPLSRFGIGFDRLLDLLSEVGKIERTDNYPPYNIEKLGEDAYRVTLAVAGFTAGELSVMSEPNLLIVSGRKPEPQDREYLYKGIAARAFERRFNLADYLKVRGAHLENGFLTIELVRELPDEMKPRRIAIASGGELPAIEQKQAA